MTTTGSDIPITVTASVPAGPLPGVRFLLRLRAAVLRNTLHQFFQDSPLKLLGTAASLLLIWGALYELLVATLLLVNRSVLEGVVATPVMFTFLFLALTGMLAFSNAILCYGILFKRPEIGYLLAGPVEPRDLVIVKFIESLVMSSWSLVLLGLPLMMALARIYGEEWSFYPLFLCLFLMFIPLPGAIGLLLAWGAVMVCPRTARRALAVAVVLIILVGAWWFRDILAAPMTSSDWLKRFYDRIGLLQNAMLPHTWVSKGIVHALQGRVEEAGYYLFVTVANSLFFSVVAVSIVAWRFMPAYTRAQSGRSRKMGATGKALGEMAEMLFAYLPKAQRLLAAKDLKAFFRDPLQWSQMAILFGLLALYVANAQRTWTDMNEPRLQLFVAFLNAVAISLILATFTSRFVFPLVSLEGQQFWLLGLLPLKRSRLIVAKFLYALTLTVGTALVVMGVSVYRLDLSRPLAAAHLVSIAATCLGLCGLSIGMGSRMPVLYERNPARIAGGFGGTVNLLLSVMLVVASLVAVGLMSYREAEGGMGDFFTPSLLLWVGLIVAFNAIVAAAALTVGIRHFNRLEW
jgi:ABC-2 type transport system permease protein